MRSVSFRERPAGPPAKALRGRSGGIGRATSEAAEAVSDALRRQTGDFLDRRRRVSLLTFGAMGSLGMVAAYQLGLLRHLPDPPRGPFHSDRVDASGEAYQYLKTPDATLGLASYAATLVLAGMGSARRESERPWVPLAMAAKVALDAAYGIYLTLEQGTKHRRFCSWCLTAAGASLATVPQVVPEAAAAWRALRRRH
jgi:hypothetical protein